MYGRDRPAVVERRLGADARRDVAAAANAHDVLAQVAAEQPRRVAEAVRMRLRSRVEQDARAVERAGAEHDAGALKSITSRVFASMTRTPTALLVASSRSTSETSEYGRIVRLPVSRAG